MKITPLAQKICDEIPGCAKIKDPKCSMVWEMSNFTKYDIRIWSEEKARSCASMEVRHL